MSPYKEPMMNSSFEDSDDLMEESSVISSPPRSQRSSSSSRGAFSARKASPNTRRLFGNNNDEEGDEDLKLSPPRRSQLRPLDLNHDLQQACRKRSSAERRGELTPRLDSSSDSADMVMYASPAPGISPNSFLTMDGRFVQSKNPFSSPMVTEEDQHFMAGAAAAPSLPTTFSDAKMPCLLPPRHQRTTAALKPPFQPPSPAPLPSGYPDRRYSFTGSPVHEDMETDSASCGSLHKVRRFNKTDDVVAASGQHLTARRKGLTIDTTVPPSVGDEISPTDVFGFPTPPTPVKMRPARTAYASIRHREPMTPVRGPPRRPPPVRTPHPGSLMHDEEETHPKSRFYGDFDVIGELGKGSFGTVYKVLSRLDGCMYAIKAAQRKAKGMADRARMLKEVYALAALSDQADTATFHIVRYHQAWMEDDLLYIQTELCQGTLSDELAHGPLSEERRYKVLREILLALEFIHRQQMVHLDIKPENIFIKNNQFKLGDFGLVTRASCAQEVEEGDSRYMSMELLSGDRSDLTKSDIFSLGATLYEICRGLPLPMNGQEWQDIRTGRLALLPNTSSDMALIIQQMMDPAPSRRPTTSQLLSHPMLLSEEQKAFQREKTKAEQATMQLAAQQHQLSKIAFPPIRRGGLTRANTWNGSSFPNI